MDKYVGNTRWNTASKIHPHLTISVGGITLSCCSSHTPIQVIQLADKQLYKAKQQGRNRTCWDELIACPIPS